jgi:hypothetical protein
MVVHGLSIVTVAWRENGWFDRWLRNTFDVAETVLVVDNSPGEHTSHTVYDLNPGLRLIDARTAETNDLAEVRNLGIELVQTEYTMTLDSDEIVDGAAVPYIAEAIRRPDLDCWFAPWNTYDRFGRLRISDYKLVMWRTRCRLRFTETVHQSVTAGARLAGLRSGYIDFPIVHQPKPQLRQHKRKTYLAALEAAWAEYPCTRIQWFLANTYLQTGRRLDALKISRMSRVHHESLHPIEVINLACLKSILTTDLSESSSALNYARATLEFYRDDIEMIAFSRKPHAITLTSASGTFLTEEQITSSCHCIDP